MRNNRCSEKSDYAERAIGQKQTPSPMRRHCCVCEHDDYQPLFRPPKSSGPVVQCRNCGFAYINPIETTKSLIQEGPVLNGRPSSLLESSNLEDIRGSWEQALIERHVRERAAKEANARDALNQLSQLPNGGRKLLDVGCFCGVFLNVAAQQNWDCYGLEPLVMPAIYARGRFRLRVKTNTLRDGLFPPHFFDVVTSFQVFEHLIDPAQMIAKIRDILRPGGLLLIEVPNIDTLAVRILRARHRHFVTDHVSFFSAETLSRLLTRMDFQVRRIYYPVRTLGLPHLAWWIGKYAGQAFGTRLAQLLTRSGLESKTARLSVRDIVAVVSERR